MSKMVPITSPDLILSSCMGPGHKEPLDQLFKRWLDLLFPPLVSAVVGMKRASTDSSHPHADGELVSVAIVRTTTRFGTQQAYRTAPIVDNRTQCTSLSAAIDKRRSAHSVGGTGRVLLPHGVQ